MKYIGKKHLNSNMYKKIRIREKDGELLISAIPNEKYKNVELIKTSTPYITDIISDLTEEKKLEEIIKYFLRNNTISSVAQKDNEIIVTSISGRQLVTNLPKKYSSILNLILDKYQNDRLKFLSEIDIKEIHITEAYLDEKFNLISLESSYGVSSTSLIDKNEVIHLNLMSQNGKLAKFDLDFIDEYLKDFINNNPNHIYLICKKYEQEYGLFDTSSKIKLSLDLFRKYQKEVIKHNKYIENENKKQLCLELKHN